MPGTSPRRRSSSLVGSLNANVVDVEHVRTHPQLRLDEVEIALQLETKGQAHCEEVLRTLRGKGYKLNFG